MSFQDSAVIFFIALLLFGPKKLPELARQLGKLMGEFRRASNDFRMQMEDELRISEQAERQKQIAAIEAAAPPPAGAELAASTAPAEVLAPHPHDRLSAPAPEPAAPESVVTEESASIPEHSIAAPLPEATPPDRYRHDADRSAPASPLPIATSGDLAMMPPASGLPVARNSAASISDAFESIPQAPATSEADVPAGSVHHG